ncbi:MAG: hypothetical protein Q8N17_18000 [Burkholderiaceae bacterium]|nr:hypothetical protein [Burkholderiaceae bacterium]
MNLIMANDHGTSRAACGNTIQEENKMAFVNEIIGDEDRKKYGLDELNNSLRMRGRTPQRDWTIDHERDIYLRQIASNSRELADFDYGERRPNFTWHFYWQGELMTVCLEVTDSGSDAKRDGHGWVRYQLMDCYQKGFFIPVNLLDQRDEIIAALRAALTAYGGGGVYSTNSTFETTLAI